MENKRWLSEITKSKICLDKICQFMRLWDSAWNNVDFWWKLNRTTKDYSLRQRAMTIVKKIPENITLFEFQASIGKQIDLLEQYPPKQMKKFLNSNNNKCKRN